MESKTAGLLQRRQPASSCRLLPRRRRIDGVFGPVSGDLGGNGDNRLSCVVVSALRNGLGLRCASAATAAASAATLGSIAGRSAPGTYSAAFSSSAVATSAARRPADPSPPGGGRFEGALHAYSDFGFLQGRASLLPPITAIVGTDLPGFVLLDWLTSDDLSALATRSATCFECARDCATRRAASDVAAQKNGYVTKFRPRSTSRSSAPPSTPRSPMLRAQRAGDRLSIQ
jgi:hypothetical protein